MHKKGLRFLTSMALVAALVVPSLAGCGKKEDKPAATTEQTPSAQATASANDGQKSVYDTSKPVEFDVYWNYSWYTAKKKWGETTISKEIEKKMNCKINFQSPGGNENEKLNIMIAADSLPDVIIMDRNEAYKKLIDLGKIRPLDEYFAKYPGYRTNADLNTVNFAKVNNKIYSILNWSTTPKHPTGNGGWMVNEKIYKELGSPNLKTLDDLYNYLVAVKEKGYKVNGKDVVPMQFAPDTSQSGIYLPYYSFGGLGTVNEDMVYQPEGTKELKFFMSDPKWEQAMIFSNKLYNAGLMNKDFFVETSQQKDDKADSGRIAVYASNNVVNEARDRQNNWRKIDPAGSYKVIEPPAGGGIPQEKVLNNVYKTLGWNSICITTKAKDPERIYQVFDWIASNEGQLITFYGPKGVLWDELDEKGYPIVKKNRSDLSKEDEETLACEVYSMPGMSEWVDFSKSAANDRLPEEKRDMVITSQSKIAWKHSYDSTAYEGLFTQATTPEGVAFKQVQDYVRKQIPKIVMAKDEGEVKSLIKETIDQAYKMKFDTVEKFKTTIWLDNLKKLGQ